MAVGRSFTPQYFMYFNNKANYAVFTTFKHSIAGKSVMTAAKAQESREKAADKRMEHAMKQAELEDMSHSFDDLSDAEIRKEEALKDEV